MAGGESLELFKDPGVGSPAKGPAALGAPLAWRMRPRSLDEVLGQEHLLAPGAPLRTLLEGGTPPSLLLWGPPGCGKTTLARLVARADPAGHARFVALSAVVAGLKDVRAVVADAERALRAGQRTVFFLDEIHRFNRAQQDALLPHVESGTLILVGATTENPSFEVVGPLLSRCRVFTLQPLAPEHLEELLRRALADPERGLGMSAQRVEEEALSALAEASDGDARRALGMLETALAVHQRGASPDSPLSAEEVQRAVGRRMLLHDRDREAHYNVVSALIKSLRASDPDASLYYLARMLEAGEDPLFVARRLVIFASEDVGNAEPAGLPLAMAAYQAVERIGLPEGRIPLAQAVTFLATAPKSNASYAALTRAQEAVARTGSASVPLHLRNAPTALMKEQGYGKGYRYPHDEQDAFVPARNLPEALADARFYEPTDRGAEKQIAERLARWRRRAGRKEPGRG